MSVRWFNLYGVHPEDRNPRTMGKREGNYYLGRVLISFSLIPNYFPVFSLAGASPSKEPSGEPFQLWIDLYEWINCTVAKPNENLIV